MTVIDVGGQPGQHPGQPGTDANAETAFDSLLDHVRAEFDTTFTLPGRPEPPLREGQALTVERQR